MASVESDEVKKIGLILSRPWRPLLIGLTMLAVCLLGSITRPAGFLALIWPANAVFFCLLVRIPDARRISVWLCTALAYVGADILTGINIQSALLLDAINLGGVGAASLVYRFLPASALNMREPASVLYVVLVSTVAAAVAGIGGMVAGPALLGIGPLDGWVFWFTSELVNYIALLPVILSAPPLRAFFAASRSFERSLQLRSVLPAVSLVLSCAFAMLIGGPGAIAFVVPALLWCALAYPVFVVSLLALMVSYWSQTILSTTYHYDGLGPAEERAMVSMRLAAFVVALAPVTLSILMRSRDELVKRLSEARERIEMAVEAGGIVATWEVDLVGRDIIIEGRVTRSLELGERASSGISLDELNALIHPDDRKRVTDALRTTIATDTNYSCRHRMLTPTGHVRWYAAFGKLLRDKSNAASHLVGIMMDFTDEAEAVEALEQSNRRFNIVSESIPQIVWSADARGRHDYFNRRWSEFTGLSPDECSPDIWKDLVHADDQARVNEVWQDCLATGKTYSLDYRFRYRDGSYRWLKVLAKPLRNPEGVVTRWYGTSTDIDDVKRLEAERDLVARELDHRIGNLFALVNGLVSLTARDATDVKSAMQDLRGRLSALHDAHALIRRSDRQSEVSLAQLLQQLLAPYATGGQNIAIVGDDLSVASSAAASIALVFHELATNAVKYGALRDGEGRLRIVLRRTGQSFCVDWQEVAPRQKIPDHRSGFGSKLFNSIVEGQLQGRAMRSYSGDGLSIHVELPVLSLQAQAARR